MRATFSVDIERLATTFDSLNCAGRGDEQSTFNVAWVLVVGPSVHLTQEPSLHSLGVDRALQVIVSVSMCVGRVSWRFVSVGHCACAEGEMEGEGGKG